MTIHTAGHILTDYINAHDEKIQGAESSSVCSTIGVPIRLFVVEPEPDLQQIYGILLSSRGFKEVVITDSGKRCLDEILKITHISKNKIQGFDMIILDKHLRDIPCIQVAKEIFH